MITRFLVAIACAASSFVLLSEAGYASDRHPTVMVEFAHQRAEGAIFDLVREANESIRILTTSMVNKDLADELVLAQRRGVDVQVLFSGAGRDQRAFVVAFLVNSGINARYTISRENLNSNFIIVDNHAVQVGSVDYSSNSFRRNHETVLIARHAPDAAAQLLRAWNDLADYAEEASVRRR